MTSSAVTLQRQRSWRSALLTWAMALPGKPFVWGQTDCASLAREAITLLFGPTAMTFLPQWTSEDGARAVLASYPPDVVLGTRFGAPYVTPRFARAGDIIVARDAEEPVGGHYLTVVIDGRIGLTSGPRGVMLIDISQLPEDSRAYSLWEIPADG